MSNHTPSYPESDISEAAPYYQGWTAFTKLATYGIVATVVLLAAMAYFLV